MQYEGSCLYRCLLQIHDDLLTPPIRHHALIFDSNPEVVEACRDTALPQATNQVCFNFALTPHLIDPKQLALVDTVVKQVPEVNVIHKQLIDQLLAASPIVRATHICDCLRHIFSQRKHVSSGPSRRADKGQKTLISSTA